MDGKTMVIIAVAGMLTIGAVRLGKVTVKGVKAGSKAVAHLTVKATKAVVNHQK